MNTYVCSTYIYVTLTDQRYHISPYIFNLSFFSISLYFVCLIFLSFLSKRTNYIFYIFVCIILIYFLSLYLYFGYLF